MDALLSGQAGIAFLINGNDVGLINIESLDAAPLSFPPSEIWLRLSSASDVVELRNVSRVTVASKLKEDYACDRSLHLTLITLDSHEEPDVRESAAECLNNLMGPSEVNEFVLNRLYAAQLPSMADVEGALRLARQHCQILHELLAQVWLAQEPKRQTSLCK